jgi:hypothetical protein
MAIVSFVDRKFRIGRSDTPDYALPPVDTREEELTARNLDLWA